MPNPQSPHGQTSHESDHQPHRGRHAQQPRPSQQRRRHRHRDRHRRALPRLTFVRNEGRGQTRPTTRQRKNASRSCKETAGTAGETRCRPPSSVRQDAYRRRLVAPLARRNRGRHGAHPNTRRLQVKDRVPRHSRDRPYPSRSVATRTAGIVLPQCAARADPRQRSNRQDDRT